MRYSSESKCHTKCPRKMNTPCPLQSYCIPLSPPIHPFLAYLCEPSLGCSGTEPR